MSCNTDICGEWEDEQETPTGQCSPRRLKRSCDAPAAYLNDTAQTCVDTCPEGSITPPITVTIGVGEVNSPFSTANANELAASLACQRAAALRAASPCYYGNDEQQCIDECPIGMDGEQITVTISANDPRFNSLSKEEANAAALAAACAEAEALRETMPCIIGAELESSFVSALKNAILIGFSEITDASTPPKKYLDCTFTGTIRGDAYNVSGLFPGPYNCLDGVTTGFFLSVNSGIASYDAVTGAFSTSGNHTITEFPVGGGSSIVLSETLNGPPTPPSLDNPCFGPTVITRLEWEYDHDTFSGGCCITQTDGFGIPSEGQIHSGSRFYTLSNEDTEENALNRAVASTGADNEAFYQPRTVFTFEYQTTHIEFDLSNLTIGVNYLITVPVTTENYGGGGSVVTQETYGFTAAGATYSFDSDEFIAERGERIILGTPVITIV